ncbi:Lin0368 family putative glycerol transporter subunit [Clostridium saccharoperbutylacetonicum]|uniref:Lin0368 family putative glycerol transporter subunit n=1 Tax=Clostridium saccharoperbutylacetonicum TaxID=36745 RepID=UPI0039E7ECA3
MKFLKSAFGYFLASIIINGFWGFFTGKLGPFGGYLAALFLTGSSWYIAHYLGLIKHDEDSAFIDMALAIGLSLVVKGYLLYGIISVISSIPTFICIAIGAILGGYVSVVIEKNIEARKSKKKIESVELERIDERGGEILCQDKL